MRTLSGTPMQRGEPPRVSAPTITTEQIAAWASQVEHGQTVTADLNDGSFVGVMEELRRRGWAPVARTERERALRPFVVRVEALKH